MAQKTEIKKDEFGLYVIAGGWISRPFYGTNFSEGDIVKSHHFVGSALVGVGNLNANFRKEETHEYWSTTGIDIIDYENLSKGKMRKMIKEYENYNLDPLGFYKEHNKKIK